MNACQKCVFAVYDDNPHCGLRGFRTSFNVERCSAENDTVPNGYELQEDGYFSWVEKKKDYPKTYEECCDKINFKGGFKEILLSDDEYSLYIPFIKLKRCRDAYWKIAGEEMGLGKPWEYDCKSDYFAFAIIYRNGWIQKVGIQHKNAILAFPTEEMRDAFYENFKKEIEICRELL